MTQRELECLYFDWIRDLVADNSFSQSKYNKLFKRLHETEFIYILPLDGNRESDGEDLRYRFAYEKHIPYAEIGNAIDIRPASVLEVMVALAIRCEEAIMSDPRYGNRTSQWFWEMLVTLGLGSMDDIRYNESYVDMVLARFMAREYEPDGRGGLFRIEGRDLRGEEIWTQMNWYIDRILF